MILCLLLENNPHICILYHAIFRAEYDCFQIELSKNYGVVEWRDDLKKVMMKAGLENAPVVFLFSDTQVCAYCIA